MLKHTIIFAVIAGLVFALAPAAQAAPIAAGDVIKLDLGTGGDGDLPAGSLADWNQMSAPLQVIAAGSVIRHGDAAVVDGVSISNVFAVGQFDDDANASGWPGQAGDPYYNFGGVDDEFYTTTVGENIITRFSGLDPSLDYNVRVYALQNFAWSDIDISVTDGAGTITRTGLNRVALWNTVPLSSDLIFSGVSPDAGNNIDIDVGSDVHGVSIQAMVLEVIPEPATLALLGLGGLGLLLRRKRA